MKFITFLGALFLTTVAAANPIEKISQNSVSQTIDKLEKIVLSKGFSVIAKVDHSAAAKKAGLELPPSQLLIFGNPKVGTKLMSSHGGIGLDLPVRILVYQNKENKVVLSYHSPSSLAATYDIKDRTEIISKMTKALDSFSSLATQK